MTAEAPRPTPTRWPVEPAAAAEPVPSLGLDLAGEVDHDQPVVIDCDRCTMRGIGCGDCVVTVLLGGPPYGVELDDVERHAIDVLSDAGLVPPLRMAEAVESRYVDGP
ncbi:MAG: hypothetical protein H0U61_06350 [Nocardioidaceae bacterium]|jgi:hypothetical protein|nr:hypothetical protein [Nocardioidaceae bacterium]